MEVQIEGMKCEGCVVGVTKALQSIPGVTEVKVSLFEERASIIASEAIDMDTIRKVVQEAGYTVK